MVAVLEVVDLCSESNPYGLFKHICSMLSDDKIGIMLCYEYNPEAVGAGYRGLMLRSRIPKCCYDEKFEVKVTFCPFCGYKATSS